MDNVDFISRRENVSLAAVMARKGVTAADIGGALAVEIPKAPAYRSGSGLGLVGTGPGTWLALSETLDNEWPSALEAALGSLASVSDQSSGYAIYRLSGANARELLQRGAAIDLDPLAFSAGSAATTVISHIGVTFWQVDDTPTYDLVVFRSMRESLEHWFESVAASV